MDLLEEDRVYPPRSTSTSTFGLRELRASNNVSPGRRTRRRRKRKKRWAFGTTFTIDERISEEDEDFLLRESQGSRIESSHLMPPPPPSIRYQNYLSEGEGNGNGEDCDLVKTTGDDLELLKVSESPVTPRKSPVNSLFGGVERPGDREVIQFSFLY